MTFAAFFDLHADDEIVARPTALRVYARLLRDPRIFFTPVEVKEWALAETLGTKAETVRHALRLLISRGYLIEHGRSVHNTRRLQVPLTRQSAPESAPQID